MKKLSLITNVAVRFIAQCRVRSSDRTNAHCSGIPGKVYGVHRPCRCVPGGFVPNPQGAIDMVNALQNVAGVRRMLQVVGMVLVVLMAVGNVRGQFSGAWTSPETEDTRSIAWGDYDNDGDLDLVVAGYNMSNYS